MIMSKTINCKVCVKMYYNCNIIIDNNENESIEDIVRKYIVNE